MCYNMVVYTGIGPVEQIRGVQTPIYVAIAITIMIVIANFGVMIGMTYDKMMKKFARYKRKKRHLKL